MINKGIFETMRVFNQRIVGLDEHIQRLKISAKIVGLNLSHSRSQLKALVKKAVQKNGGKDLRLKLALWQEKDKTHIRITVKKYLAYSKEKYYKGFSALTSDLRQNELSKFSRVKSLERALFESAYLRARSLRVDEAVIFNSQGKICECSRANIFLVKNKKVFTPDIASGCLPGITRRVVIGLCRAKGIKVAQCPLGIQELYSADEAFLTNSLIGVMPLVAVDRKPIGCEQVGRITHLMMQEYNKLLENSEITKHQISITK